MKEGGVSGRRGRGKSARRWEQDVKDSLRMKVLEEEEEEETGEESRIVHERPL